MVLHPSFWPVPDAVAGHLFKNLEDDIMATDVGAAAAGAGLDAGQIGNISDLQNTMKSSQAFMMEMQKVGIENSAMTTAIKTLGDEAQDSVKQRPQV